MIIVLTYVNNSVYRKNKRPIGHWQANTDPGILLPLSCLLVVTLGEIQTDFHRFWLAQQSMDVCPTSGTPPACAVSMGNVNRTASSPGAHVLADLRAVECRLSRLP